MDAGFLEIILLVILIPIVVIALLFVVIGAFRISACSDLPKVMYDIDFDSINTGDILGVGYTHPFGWFVKAWSGSTWSHTGIAWRDPDDGQLYVLEAATYSKTYQGVMKIPIVNWIRFNRKSHIGISKLRGKTLDPIVLINAFEKRSKYLKLEPYNLSWYRLLYKTPYYDQKRESYTCYEIVITILQDVGVIRKKYTCSSYFPCDIMEGRIDLSKDYTLDPPRLLNVEHHTKLRQAEDHSKNKAGGCINMILSSWSHD